MNGCPVGWDGGSVTVNLPVGCILIHRELRKYIVWTLNDNVRLLKCTLSLFYCLYLHLCCKGRFKSPNARFILHFQWHQILRKHVTVYLSQVLFLERISPSVNLEEAENEQDTSSLTINYRCSNIYKVIIKNRWCILQNMLSLSYFDFTTHC